MKKLTKENTLAYFFNVSAAKKKVLTAWACIIKHFKVTINSVA